MSMATQNLIPKTPEVAPVASTSSAQSLGFTPSPKSSERPKKKKRPSLLQQVQKRRIFQREIDSLSQESDKTSVPSTPEKIQEVDSAAAIRKNILSLFASSPGSGSSADDEAESTEKVGMSDVTMAFVANEQASNETILSDKTMAFEKTMAMDETVNVGRQKDFDKTVFMEQTVMGDPETPDSQESTEAFMRAEKEASRLYEEENRTALAKPVVVTANANRTLQNILE